MCNPPNTHTRYQGYFYYTRTEEGAQYALHCRRRVPPGLGAPTEADAPDEGQVGGGGLVCGRFFGGRWFQSCGQ